MDVERLSTVRAHLLHPGFVRGIRNLSARLSAAAANESCSQAVRRVDSGDVTWPTIRPSLRERELGFYETPRRPNTAARGFMINGIRRHRTREEKPADRYPTDPIAVVMRGTWYSQEDASKKLGS